VAEPGDPAADGGAAFYELTDARGETQGESPVTMTYRYQGKNEYYKPIVPKWQHPLRDAIGEEAFGEVTGVQLMRTAVTDDDLRFLAAVPTIEYINLANTQVTDAGLVHLRACPKLNTLQFDGMPITDAGIAELTRHQNLDIALAQRHQDHGCRARPSGQAAQAERTLAPQHGHHRRRLQEASSRLAELPDPGRRAELPAEAPAPFLEHGHPEMVTDRARILNFARTCRLCPLSIAMTGSRRRPFHEHSRLREKPPRMAGESGNG
jgi:hypothetical protein